MCCRRGKRDVYSVPEKCDMLNAPIFRKSFPGPRFAYYDLCTLVRLDKQNRLKCLRLRCADLLHVFSYLPRDLNFIQHTSDIGWKE